jgi:hypothetical protein
VNAFISKYGETAYRIVIVLGMAGLYFLNATFVSNARYDADKAAVEVAHRVEAEKVNSRLDGIEKAILIMTEENKAQAVQDAKLADHETRIRALESKR